MRSQIKGIIGLIETKRDEWSANVNDETFRQFVHNVIHNANWKKGKPLKIEEIEKAAISGKLNDIVELYMYVMKEKEEDLEVEELA
jgi:hypothetical protein